MPRIRAFQGIRYNTQPVNIANALCPPYDSISPAQLEAYYKKAPYNAVRLVLGKQLPKDTKTDNRYSRARDFFQQWIKDKTLIQDDKPALYFHEHVYNVAEKTHTRRGVIAAVKLDETGEQEIIAHEYTHKGPKIDRLRLMNEVRANVSSIFGLYSDKDKIIETGVRPNLGEPLWEISTMEGQQRFWKITDPDLIHAATCAMADKKILLADGHHRYETARAYRDRMRTQTGLADGGQPFDDIMMYLCNSDEGLTIMPTHRVVVDSMGIGLVDIEYRVKDIFNMVPFDNRRSFLDALRKGGRGTIGLRVAGISRYYLLELIDPAALDRYLASDVDPLLKRLDVMILHSCVLEPILGIDASVGAKRLEFTSNAAEALDMVEKEKADIAFLLNPSTVQEVLDIAGAGLRMPQKSTFFYPKVPAGLVFHLLE